MRKTPFRRTWKRDCTNKKGRHCKVCGCNWVFHRIPENHYKKFLPLGKCTNVLCYMNCERYIECYHGPKHTHMCAKCHQEFEDADIKIVPQLAAQEMPKREVSPSEEKPIILKEPNNCFVKEFCFSCFQPFNAERTYIFYNEKRQTICYECGGA